MNSENLTVNVYLNTLKQKGKLAYEYNPFYNYQTDEDLYLIDNKYIIPSNKAVNLKNGEILTKKTLENGNEVWVDKRGTIITDNYKIAIEGKPWATAGSLIDLDTDQLNFDLEHPVEIEVLPSYDGSVNLILNDNKNIPRLINSRFSVREKDTYEIVDRIGENDTNIYNSKTFDKDTSLYFLYTDNPLITYLGFVKGNLPVGQYCFYFTYCDADNNESDYIAESGLIPVFIGDDNNPRSINGGIKNLTTNKGIKLRLNNVDKSYNYLKIYYVRYFADYLQNRVVECKEIYKKYPINSNTLYLQITGYEEGKTIDPNILNFSRFNPKSVLTQALCKNMLFFGNIVKNTDNYKELTDLALRIVPSLNHDDNFSTLNLDYLSSAEDCAYYNSSNIYNKTGYFNQEYYRFGVVFIYNNGTLSNVYNTLGGVLDDNNSLKLEGSIQSEDGIFLIRNYVLTDDRGWVKSGNYDLDGRYVNSKGVCFLDYNQEYSDSTIFSIKFTVPLDVIKYLKEELGIRGLFFVRQKCVPNLIAQCYLLSMDEVLLAPVLEEKQGDQKKYYSECFLSQYNEKIKKKIGLDIRTVEKGGRYLTNEYDRRLYTYNKAVNNSRNYEKSISTKAFAGLCPDFSLNLPYYNQIFNGSNFRLLKVSKENSSLLRNGRFYNEDPTVTYMTGNESTKVTINSVTDDVPTVAIKDCTYRLEIGKTEEVFRFKYAEVDSGTYDIGGEEEYRIKETGTKGTSLDAVNEATNLVRGKYSPYLAIYSESKDLETGCLYNIYLDISLSSEQEFQNRMDSHEAFYAISDRYNFTVDKNSFECWRGDCYINLFTHRLNRNFNDPSLPNNDVIIDSETWRDHYDITKPEEWEKISRSDVNAVMLGSWITFKVRSAMNYALRSEDSSYVSEKALMGAPRSFYPKSELLARGENKMPDSYLYNDAYRASLGYKCYFPLQDINYLKDTYSNRIQYSAIAILDSYKNNYRYSLSTYFKDYSSEYGSIQKLLEVGGDLIVVFEHGIGKARVNEKILAGGKENTPVFINSKEILPDLLEIISDTYGSQWKDSVIKTDSGNIYGVDTVAKKIWRIRGNRGLEIISDFKVNKFLIDNISLGEKKLSPIIGIRNVKTHYNANKLDVIFTFYDDVYKDEEKVWSLCYNELLGERGLGQFVTFYSWLPSYSANIDNKFFTFDRDTAKKLALLEKSNYAIPENTGVLVDNPVFTTELNTGLDLYYVPLEKTFSINNYDISIQDRALESLENTYEIHFKVEKDHWHNYQLFNVDENNRVLNNKLFPKDKGKLSAAFKQLKVIFLYITPQIEFQNLVVANTSNIINFQTEIIAVTLDSIVENPLLTLEEKTREGLTTDFYLHGLAGLFDVVENLYPTYWYGEQHPFEFEFIVNDKIGQLKIFENLILISNKAEPESFHFEIEGDNYEFSLDKRNMYFRLEATKNLYQNLGSDILYNRQYTDVAAIEYTLETYYRPKVQGNVATPYKGYPIHYHDGLVQLVKSTIFPLYYEKIDTYNDIYHQYHLMHNSDATYDFLNLSGSEITWNRDANQFNIITHIKNSPMDLVGRLRGNSRYKEGRWEIQIPSIIFNLKNEENWPTVPNELREGPLAEVDQNYKIPPIIINSLYVPTDLTTTELRLENLPNIYTGRFNYVGETPRLIEYVKTSPWTYRKETKIRDKWMKVRIRYSGKNLAIIHSIATLYNISLS